MVKLVGIVPNVNMMIFNRLSYCRTAAVSKLSMFLDAARGLVLDGQGHRQ